MGRPAIDDDMTLLEIGVLFNKYPDERFSAIFRRLPDDLFTGEQSRDSARSRVQKKFYANRDHWLARGASEQWDRQMAVIAKMGEQMQEAAVRMADTARPQIEMAQRVLDQVNPSLLAAQRAANRALRSPMLQHVINNYERASGKRFKNI